ncbi:MAG: ribosome silencing factor [Desulfobacteraceae bacterium]|nr:ribosome silencing factor [Desulfobacteraceae bacterium]
MSDDLDPSLDFYVKAALGRKVLDLVILDVRDLTSIADAFIICSGHSNRQVAAIAESIQVELKKHGIRPLSVEGKKEGHWVLLDYGHVIMHVFYEPVRSFYDLEGLWIDAKRIKTPSLINASDQDLKPDA